MWYDTVFFACLGCSVRRETVVDGSGGEVGRKCSRIEYNGAGYYHTLNGYRTRDTFVYVHSVVWEEHLGPIPHNYVVSHREGDRSNNAIGNLDLLSHREHWWRKLATQTSNCLECDRPVRSRGLCTSHYQQLRAQDRGGWQVVKGKAGQHS
jgi:hypothetical protein